jgi:hypothetical protein
MPVKHAFTSAKSDGGDSTQVQPSNWNADHSIDNGTAGAPAIAPSSDPNTGFYFDGADKILVSTGGTAFGGWNTTRSQFEVGAQVGFAPTNQLLGSFTGTLNGFEQVVIQNFSAGTDASSDLVICNDASTDTTNYLDLGLNSTGYTTNFFGSARDGYLYVNGATTSQGSLWLGTGQAGTKVRVSVGGGASSNVVCDFNENGINLPVKASWTAPTEGLNVFNRSRAGRNLLTIVGPSGIDTALQPAMFGNSIYMWLPGTATTVSINFGTNFTARNAGTGAAQAHPTKASTNALTSMNRATFSSGTTATGASGVQSGATVAWRGNAAGLGGFFFFARFAVETHAADTRNFIGLSANNAAMAADPSTWNHTIGLCKDVADTNWQLLSRGTAATKTDTGLAVAADTILDLTLFCKPNDTKITARLVNTVTGAVYLDNVDVTANLPGNTTFMFMQAHHQSTTTATATLLALNRLYCETDL